MSNTSWKVLDERRVFSRPPYLSILEQRVELPNGKVIDDYYQIELPDFASIFAETEDGRVIMLRGYRHGPRRVCTMFPGGGIGTGEVPIDAARRELLEETGYEAADLAPLGNLITNTNQRCQTAFFFKATGCHRVATPRSGDLEDTEVILVQRADVAELFRSGECPSLSQLGLFALVALHGDAADLLGPWGR